MKLFADQYGFVQKNYLRGYDIVHYEKPTEIEVRLSVNTL